MTDADRQELADLERQGWDALSADGAAGPFYDDLLDDEVLFLLPGGMVMDDRSAVVEAMSGAPWASFELDDVRVVPLGDDAAVVGYGALARREGADPYSALMSSTYVRRAGRWRLAVHQQTPR